MRATLAFGLAALTMAACGSDVNGNGETGGGAGGNGGGGNGGGTTDGVDIGPVFNKGPDVPLGPVPVDSSDVSSVAVRNGGDEPRAISGVSIEANSAGEFEVVEDGCAGVELAPGEECAVQVQFAPVEEGARAAKLLISGPTDSWDATLKAEGQVQRELETEGGGEAEGFEEQPAEEPGG